MNIINHSKFPFWILLFGLATACNLGTKGNESSIPTDSLPSKIAADSTSPFIAPSKERIKENTGALKKFIQGTFSIPKAMAVVYGLYDEKLECSKWICAAEERPGFKEMMAGDGHVFTRSKIVLDFQSGGFNHKFLVTETPKRGDGGWQNCHACDVVLGLALFTEIDNDWFIQVFRRELGRFGSYGELPKPELMNFSTDNFGIRIVESSTNQGETETHTTLIGLSAERFEVLWSGQSAYSNEGMFFPGFHAEKAYTWEAKMAFEKGKREEFDDLRVTYKGTHHADISDENSKIVPFNESLVYHYNGRIYEPEDIPAQ